MNTHGRTYQRKHTLKGGALIYVILLSMLISSLLSALLLINHYQGILTDKNYFYTLAKDNLDSGLQLFFASNASAKSFETQLFDSEIDSFSLQRETWGLFHLLHTQAQHGSVDIQKSCLVGERIPKSHQFSLYLTDKRQPLILTGDTYLKGKLFLPASGIRRGNIGRISYQRPQLFEGISSPSSSQSKPLLLPHKQELIELLSRLSSQSASGETYLLQEAYLQQQWNKNTYDYESPHSLILENSEIRDKVLVYSPGNIKVRANSRLSDCILVAKTIEIEAGFQGALQAFATEHIHIGAQASLRYPSVLMLAKHAESAQLVLAENSEVQGAVIFESDLFRQSIHREDYVSIRPGAKVYGSLFAQHNLDLQGEVYGQVITDGFLLRTSAASYRNHLMNAIIDFDGLSPRYGSPLLFGGKEQKLIKWL